MKKTILASCILGLAVAAHGLKAQTSVAPQAPAVTVETVPPTAVLKYATFEVGLEQDPWRGAGNMRSRVVAKSVEIQMGDNLLTADEAQVRYGGPGELDVVELRGTIRLKAKVRVNSIH